MLYKHLNAPPLPAFLVLLGVIWVLTLNWSVTEWVPKFALNWVEILTAGGLPVQFCTTRNSFVTISITWPVWKVFKIIRNLFSCLKLFLLPKPLFLNTILKVYSFQSWEIFYLVHYNVYILTWKTKSPFRLTASEDKQLGIFAWLRISRVGED